VPPSKSNNTSPVGVTSELRTYRIVRDDGREDGITRLHFTSYDEAYDELERFYAGTCCSDERIEYSILPMETSSGDP